MTLAEIKAEPRLAKMELIRQSRLSVAPVRDEEWKVVLELAGPLNCCTCERAQLQDSLAAAVSRIASSKPTTSQICASDSEFAPRRHAVILIPFLAIQNSSRGLPLGRGVDQIGRARLHSVDAIVRARPTARHGRNAMSR